MKLRSSLILAATHYGSKQELHVVLKKGRDTTQRLVYKGVSERVWLELVTSASPGRYFNQEVKGCYERL
jgi:hypothetical protein